MAPNCLALQPQILDLHVMVLDFHIMGLWCIRLRIKRDNKYGNHFSVGDKYPMQHL